ncbi:MAG: Asp-tRNA(Asn)/Glu-tRNA(Gln) amidotransferase subunit GatA [Lachnospiraceae bacterium]|nr:Asp-tRNA(Asn)/Glu-tRNA(Gln) amidotransferase subunit GatA [Lachnospiraceae bacterium]
MKDYKDLSARSLGQRIQEGTVDAVEAAKDALAAIEEAEEKLHAFLHILPRDVILARAGEVQARVERKELTSPLAGVPFAVKDNLCVAGVPTTCGSRMLSNYIPSYTSTAVQKLLDAGAILIGKTNMDEFAMGSSTETSYFGPSKNPFDPSRTPGGSSGGSAVSVAAGFVPFSLGTDTGGSVRQPASFCGLVGWKPSYGLISRNGLIAYASSMDVVGTFTKDPGDALMLMSMLAGKDPKDSTSLDFRFVSDTKKPEAKGLRIGIPTDLLQAGVDPAIRKLLYKCADRWREAGASVTELELGHSGALIPAYYTIACAEASSNLERYDGVKYGYRADQYAGLSDLYKKSRSQGFGAEVRRRILIGTFVLSREYYDAYYRKALQVRRLIAGAFEAAFRSFDFLLTPVAPGTAPLLGEYEKDPVGQYASDLFTVGANLTGGTAVSFPVGLSDGGLPVGLQLIGAPGRDRAILRFLEENLPIGHELPIHPYPCII